MGPTGGMVMETMEDSNDIKCRDRELMNREHG